MRGKRQPKPPETLTPTRQKLWKVILVDFELSDAELEVLRLALEALDTAAQARELVKKDGLTTTNRYGCIVAHPAVAIKRDARLAAGRLLRQLGLELSSDPFNRRRGRTPCLG